jgi:hypothetical protein
MNSMMRSPTPGTTPERTRNCSPERAFHVQPAIHHRVSSGRFAESFGAALWDSLLGVEVDVDQPEPVGEAVHPFEVVLGVQRKQPSTGTPRRRCVQIILDPIEDRPRRT